jgi:hypothetical protein
VIDRLVPYSGLILFLSLIAACCSLKCEIDKILPPTPESVAHE